MHCAFNAAQSRRMSRLLLAVACCGDSQDDASLCSTGLSSEVEDPVLSPWQEALARADRSAREYAMANKVRGEAKSCKGARRARGRLHQRQLYGAYRCKLAELLSLACPDAARSVNVEKALNGIEHPGLGHRTSQRP